MAGNWKMNLSRESGLALAGQVSEHVDGRADLDVVVFPPFVYLDVLARALSGSQVAVGAQNCSQERSGAFTGEVSAAQIADVGARFVIVGHSERRRLFGETDELV